MDENRLHYLYQQLDAVTKRDVENKRILIKDVMKACQLLLEGGSISSSSEYRERNIDCYYAIFWNDKNGNEASETEEVEYRYGNKLMGILESIGHIDIHEAVYIKEPTTAIELIEMAKGKKLASEKNLTEKALYWSEVIKELEDKDNE